MNCLHAARLTSEAMDRPLTIEERFTLRVHLLTCRGCRGYEGQLSVLRDAARRMAGGRVPEVDDSVGKGTNTDPKD